MSIKQMSHEVAERIGVPSCDLTDARDREAVIEWLIAKGWVVRLDHGPNGHCVIIWTDEGPSTLNPHPIPTIAEALGRAFLAATGAE